MNRSERAVSLYTCRAHWLSVYIHEILTQVARNTHTFENCIMSVAWPACAIAYLRRFECRLPNTATASWSQRPLTLPIGDQLYRLLSTPLLSCSADRCRHRRYLPPSGMQLRPITPFLYVLQECHSDTFRHCFHSI
jgi:hypothetical protein